MTTTPSPEPQTADAGGWSDWPRKSQDMRYEIGACPGGDAWAFCPYCDNSIDQSCDVTIVSHDGSLALAHTACIPDECRTPAPQAQPDARAVEGEPAYRVTWVNDGSNDNDRRMYVDGQQWAKVYGWDKASLDARCDALNAALSAPAADDGWRPSREDVARAIDLEAFATSDDYEPPIIEKRRAEHQARAFAAADRVLALHPAAEDRAFLASRTERADG